MFHYSFEFDYKFSDLFLEEKVSLFLLQAADGESCKNVLVGNFDVLASAEGEEELAEFVYLLLDKLSLDVVMGMVVGVIGLGRYCEGEEVMG